MNTKTKAPVPDDYKPPIADGVESSFRLDQHIIATIPEKKQELVVSSDKTDDEQVQEDFDAARSNIKKILEKSEGALNGILLLAQASDHPRAFEVAAIMMKTLADLNKDMLDLHKKKKDLKPAPTQQAETINNNQNNVVFNGTAAELQKYLRGEKTD